MLQYDTGTRNLKRDIQCSTRSFATAAGYYRVDGQASWCMCGITTNIIYLHIYTRVRYMGRVVFCFEKEGLVVVETSRREKRRIYI